MINQLEPLPGLSMQLLVDGEYRFQVELVRRWFERDNQIVGF
jgi:hypothetical protein